MSGTPSLTPTERRVVEAALRFERQDEAAAAARMSPRSLRRYLAREDVSRAIQAETLTRLRRVAVALGRHAEGAAEVLGGMACGTVPPTLARVAACRAVIEFSLRVLEVEGVEARLADLEAHLLPESSGPLGELPPWAGGEGEPS